MAVAEGNYGRLGPDQQARYTDQNARLQLDPALWELPGAMPEVAPSPDFTANIDRPFYDRSMALQAWGGYGVLWPVVHQQLGVSPDLGAGTLAVVPQVPAGQSRVAGSALALGRGAADVTATHEGGTWRIEVRLHDVSAALTVGVVLPAGSHPSEVTLDGRVVAYQAISTTRGVEIRVPATGGHADLTVTT
jgi:hypothetical protein